MKMQRNEADGVVISCDFCRVDWDGQAPMVEGHHGSVICLDCLKLALGEAQPGEGKYQCTLCLRINIPPTLPRWHHAQRPEVLVCQECLHQAARAMHKAPHVNFKWEGVEKKPQK
jgi:hypothetical protein